MSMSKISLKDFDLLGLFEIKSSELDKRLLELVTYVKNDVYLSRSKLYWQQISTENAANMREELYKLLAESNLEGKNAFIAMDYVANLSGKVYYKACEDFINNKCSIEDVNKAKSCLLEDIRNIISLIEKNTYSKNNNTLPILSGDLADRNIECNNMALLYIFTKSLQAPKDFNVLNTGLGGIFIGPFFSAIYGNNWTNLLKSKYVSTNVNNDYSILERIVDISVLENKKVLFLDDNVGTGSTMIEIKQDLEALGYDFKCGAVQYNWINYYRVSIGEKNIEKFNPALIDYVTQINYPGHKLLEHAISIIKGERDSDGNTIYPPTNYNCGENYQKYKNNKHYYDQDLESLQEKSVRYANLANFKIFDIDTCSEFNENLTNDTKLLMAKIAKYINLLKEDENQ